MIHEHLHHTIPLSHHDRLDAELAKDAYSLPGTDNYSTNHRITSALHQSAQLNPDLSELKHMHVLDSSSDYAILKNPTTNTCYLDVRGTELTPNQHTMLRDLFNDGQIAVGDIPHRVQTIYNKYLEFKELNPSCHWDITGHSLRGTIAEKIGELDPTANVTSFESGGNPFEHYDHDYSNITSHKIKTDPISLGDSPGVAIYHDNINNGYSTHSIFNYTQDYSQLSW